MVRPMNWRNGGGRWLWGAGLSVLFAERNRADAPYSHRGRLHVPASSQFIHLVSLTKGAMRMVMVSGLDQLGRMQGLITTVAKDGAAMRPVSAPIVYLRRDDIDDADCGEITPGSALYAPYARDLFEPVTTGLVRLIGQTGPA